MPCAGSQGETIARLNTILLLLLLPLLLPLLLLPERQHTGPTTWFSLAAGCCRDWQPGWLEQLPWLQLLLPSKQVMLRLGKQRLG